MEIVDYTVKMDDLRRLIGKARPEHQQDLMTMYQNVRNIYLLLQVAAIDCRRLKTVTATYASTANRFEQMYSEVEQMTTLALLL